MSDGTEFWEERKQNKVSSNPRARFGDPACWETLSDEQRDAIHDWYCDLMKEEHKKRQKAVKLAENAALFASTPVIFFTTLLAYANRALWEAMAGCVGGLVVGAIATFVAREGYVHFMKGRERSVLWNVFAVLVSFGITFAIASIVYTHLH